MRVETEAAHSRSGAEERGKCARGKGTKWRTGTRTGARERDDERVKRDLARKVEAAVGEVDDAQGVRHGGVEVREREERVLDGRINVISVATFPNTSST